MNSDEFNKIAGGVIGAALIFLLLGFFSGKIFGTGGGHHGEEQLAFALEIEEDAGADEEVEIIDLASLALSPDLDAGKKAFAKCKACHKVEDGANGVGPHLWGVVGRDIAGLGDYAFSDALAGKEGVWELENLSAFLENPKGWAPGTKMGYSGMKDPEDRVNLIAWLNAEDGTPVELAAAPAETATDAVAEETATEEVVEEVTEATEEAATAVVEETETAAATAVEAAEEAVETATEAVEEAAEDVTEAVTETVEETTEAVEEATETVVAAATGGGAYGDLLAAADAKAGKKVFRKCRACHKLDEGKNGVGPSLWGVIGRDIAGVDGFNYSDAMAAKDGDWTLDELMAFLEAPKSYVAGTKMAFAGVKDAQDRINLITYLNEADGTPDPLQ